MAQQYTLSVLEAICLDAALQKTETMVMTPNKAVFT